jgi:hypothetical protein
VQRDGGVLVHALAVPGEDVLGIDPPERPRRRQPEDWVHADGLARRAEVADGSERVGCDEYAPLRPPQRDLAPEPVAEDRQEVERRDLRRHDVVRHTERRGKCGAVAVVAVEELEHPSRLPALPHSPLGVGPGHRIDQPHAAVDDERVGGAANRVVVVDPAEAEVLLVAEAHVAELS